jgi:hypothetical protein
MPSTFEFCLPTSAASVPDRPVWLHEVKYDVVKVVCTEILNSGVVVMESAKDRARIDDTGPLNRARDRRILLNDR